MSAPRHVVIIGGGLAGAKTAEALRGRGGGVRHLQQEPAAGVQRWVVDPGFAGDRVTPTATLAEWSGAPCSELIRLEARARVRYLLTPGTVLCLPTTPLPAPPVGQPLSALGPIRDRILCLCAHGGLTGVPQVNIPGSTVDGLPVGLSLLAAPGADALLAGIALALEGAA